jgi:hypothetical protein
MRKTVRRRHEAQVRVQSVCAEYSVLFDATPGGQKARAALGTDVADVDRLLALQQASIEERRAATEQCRLSRRTLRDADKAVTRVGRVVNIDAAVTVTMRLPEGRSDEELLAYSRGLLEHVSEHADAFVAEGLPPDLLKHLDAGIAEFVAAREAQAGARQRFTAASQSIRDTLDHADKMVDVLEAIVINATDAPPEVLTTLRIAKRVGPRVTAPPKAPQSTPTDKAA